MIIYLKDTMGAIQTLIITGIKDISNSDISIIACVICNNINILIDTQTIRNKIK